MKYLPRLGFVWFVAALALSSAAHAGTTVWWNFDQATDIDFLAETTGHLGPDLHHQKTNIPIL